MDSKMNENLWANYIEVPLKKNGPVKLDKILEKRLKAFLKARVMRMHAKERRR